jgi:protein subunit release factor A
MTKYEDLIKQRKKKSISLEAIFRKYKMSVSDVKILQEWKEKYEKEHKLRQEAETETILVKGIGMNSPEMKAAKNEINDLKNKIADLENTLESKDYFKDPDYQYLINENRRLESERNELIMDNKKLATQIEDKIDQLRKSGM